MQRDQENVDDRELLRRAQRNEVEALKTIHNRYFASLYNYALYRICDPMAAEDITSEVFVRLLEVIQRPAKQPRSLRRWLFGVAHNVMVDYQRHHYRHQTTELVEEQPLLSTDQENPVYVLENNLQIGALRKALTQLTDEQKEVLALRFGADLSIKLTAKVMGKSVNAVKVLQFRALKALQAHLMHWQTQL